MYARKVLPLLALLLLVGQPRTGTAAEPEPLLYTWPTPPGFCIDQPSFIWPEVTGCIDHHAYKVAWCHDTATHLRHFDWIVGDCPPPVKPVEPGDHSLFVPLAVSGSFLVLCAPGAGDCPWPGP